MSTQKSTSVKDLYSFREIHFHNWYYFGGPYDYFKVMESSIFTNMKDIEVSLKNPHTPFHGDRITSTEYLSSDTDFLIVSDCFHVETYSGIRIDKDEMKTKTLSVTWILSGTDDEKFVESRAEIPLTR